MAPFQIQRKPPGLPPPNPDYQSRHTSPSPRSRRPTRPLDVSVLENALPDFTLSSPVLSRQAPSSKKSLNQQQSRSVSPAGSQSINNQGSHGKPLYLCAPFVDAALVKGNYKKITKLPKYVEVNEWIAVNIFDFCSNLNEFYGVLSECCTQRSCPAMSAGLNVNYTYSQVGGSQKRVALSAPAYIDATMSYIQSLLSNPEVFPADSMQSFPKSFPSTIRHMYRELLRVFAHLYHAHYHHVLHLRVEPHFNSLFAHFLAFGREYELLDEKDVKGKTGEVGVGKLWVEWRERGILE